MADSVYFQNKDDLKKTDIQDAATYEEAITHASDYINLANKVNAGFDMVEVNTDQREVDISLPMRSSVGTQDDVLFADQPNIRSAKVYKQYVDGMVHGDYSQFDTLDKTGQEAYSPARYLYNQIVEETVTAAESVDTVKSNTSVCKDKIQEMKSMEDHVLDRIEYAATLNGNMKPGPFCYNMTLPCNPF